MKHTFIQGERDGTIIFIHGNSSSSKVFQHILNSKNIRHSMLAVDLPGHGSSLNGYNREENFFMGSYLDQLSDLIQSIDDDIVLVGNSLGGHIAIELAPRIADKLLGLVVFGTPPLKKPLNFEEAFLPEPALQTFFTENPPDNEIQEAANVAVFDEDKAPVIFTDFKNAHPKVRTALGVDVANGRLLNEYEIFTGLPVSKYIIAGAQDPTVNGDYLNEVVKASAGHCELIEFSDCGHYPSLERPLQFEATLIRIANEVFK
ncbi:alpha/beta hydrolase [Hyunsoonleella sp. SJ7]|uniref:Alpha/beta hydrolase n=1 Tax=Hyunsoonleella aquatilis TaxID=2762758 RepID=A0A923HF44_9FLAO|nr:alpha/beta hydrolase [Hyunsoonleella aquatilis]MBC3759103.1 alpha/beta hydrolase [Hyunsoonleella aquatilis]